MKLSIIIPAYNVSKYIGKCLDSVIDQNLPASEYEIIVVNDGSTDNTLSVIEKYKCNNLQIINQTNQGLSMSRNNGLRQAHGEYIWFIDGDDYIEKNSLRHLYETAVAYNTDILFFQLTEVSIAGSIKKQTCVEHNVAHNKPLSGKEAILRGYSPASACAALYRRLYLISSNLLFRPGIYHEDSHFNYRAVSFADKVVFLESSPYYYVKRDNSMTTDASAANIVKITTDNIIIAKSFHEFADSIDDPELTLKIHSHADSMIFGVAVQMLNYHKAGKTSLVAPVIDYMRRSDVFPIRMQHPGWKHRLYTPYLNFRLRNY